MGGPPRFGVACPAVCCRGTGSRGSVRSRSPDFAASAGSRDSGGTPRRQSGPGRQLVADSVAGTLAGRPTGGFRGPAVAAGTAGG